MQPYIQYLSSNYFRSGELFCISLYNEAVKEFSTLHSHDFIEICYVSSGHGFHVLNGHETAVKKGDLFIINYEADHMFYRTSDVKPLYVYNIVFKPGFFDKLLIDLNDFQALTCSYLFDFVDSSEWDQSRFDLQLGAQEQEDVERLLKNLLNEYNLQLPDTTMS